MVDRSNCPCAVCGHRQRDHNKRFAACYECPFGRDISPQHYYERLDNLEYLEWAYKQKES